MKTSMMWVGSCFLTLATVIAALGFWSYTHAAGTTITGCADKSGLVFLIGPGFLRTKCERNQTTLTWNIIGPQGLKGDPGVPGAPGRDGVNGQDGVPGQKGDTGSTGATGAGIIGGGMVFVASSQHTEYASAFTSYNGGANESDVAQTLPVGGTLSLLNIRLNENSSFDYTFTVMKNGTATAVTCSITNPANSCNDATDSVVFNANDTISVRVSGSGSVNTMRWTAKYQ